MNGLKNLTLTCVQVPADQITFYYHDQFQEDGIVGGLDCQANGPLSLSLEEAINLRDALSETIAANS